MRFGPPCDRPRRDHGTFFTVDDHNLAGVAHYDVEFGRGQVERQAGRILAFDVDAGDERAGLYIDDLDGTFRTCVRGRVRAVAELKQMSGWIVDAVVGNFSGILVEIVP